MKKTKKGISLLMSLAMGASLLSPLSAAAEESDDVLVVIPYATIETGDPYAASGNDMSLMCQVFNYLFEYDENGDPTPCLVDYYEISEDGKTYTMYLRQDVTFHDGCQFTTDDVIFSYDTMAATNLGSTLTGAIGSVTKIDDYTIEMVKGTAYASVEKFLCGYLTIVDSEAYGADPDSYITNPIGTGAYMVDHMDETTGYVYLTANENYFQGAPEVKNVEIHVPLDSAVALVALQNGEADFAYQLNNSDIEIAKEDDSLVVQGTEGWSQQTVLLIGEPYNSDENLRKAIYYAINRENAAIFNGEIEVKAAENMYADKLMGDYAGTVDMEGYDPDKAAEYLAASNYDGSTLEINVTSDKEQIAVSMQADLTALGISCQVNLVDVNTITNMMYDCTLGITVLDYGVAYSSPEEMMSYFASTGYYGEQGMVATSEEFDAAVAAMADIWNDEERFDAAVEALQAFKDLAIYFPLFTTSFYTVSSAEYDNVQAVWAATYSPYLYQVTYAE